MLIQHEIEVYPLGRDLNKSGKSFKKDKAFVIPMNQDQYRLAKAIFETRTSFNDSLFYDVSTWTMTHAFDIPVKGWYDKNGDIWKSNTIITFLSSTFHFNTGKNFLIKSVRYEYSQDGAISVLSLIDPETFL